jgi:hypothetical protein
MNMKRKAETKNNYCEFCEREFVREGSFLKHICETKRRYQNQDLQGNRIGFQVWLDFYKKNSASKKQRTYIDFAKNAYYIAFVKFGNYCVDANVLNIKRYSDYLIKNKISVDSWASDKHYTNFLIQHLREEDPLDAVARSIETTISLAQEDKILAKDYLRYGNKHKACYAISTGRLSPWLLFNCESGVKFLESLDETQLKMVIDYIDPEKWSIKFKRELEVLKQVKDLLIAGGY